MRAPIIAKQTEKTYFIIPSWLKRTEQAMPIPMNCASERSTKTIPLSRI
jgi:hypothetical protein